MASAADFTIHHRYGAIGALAQTAPPPAGPRAVATKRAALEFKQLLDSNTVVHSAQSLRGKGAPPVHIFVFKLPLDQVLQSLAPSALEIAGRHGTAVAVLQSYAQGMPETVLVIANNPTLAHRYFKTGQHT